MSHVVGVETHLHRKCTTERWMWFVLSSVFVSVNRIIKSSVSALFHAKRRDGLEWYKLTLSSCCSCPTLTHTRCSPKSTSPTSSVWFQVKTPSTHHASSCSRSSTGHEWGPSTRTNPVTLWWVVTVLAAWNCKGPKVELIDVPRHLLLVPNCYNFTHV